jgi:V8-like Glu-specific endopeptidase/uncharacterized membrane protein
MASHRRSLVVAFCLFVLVAAPAVGVVGASNHSPYPYHEDVDVPDSVTVGESFTVEVDATNFGGPADKYSTITVSSPSLDGYGDDDQVHVVSHSFSGYATKRSPGDRIYHREDGAMTAEHALVEAGTARDGAWGDSEDRSLTVEFTPEEAGTFVLYVRTTMTDDGEQRSEPGYGRHTDQQGYTVERYVVEVREKPDIDAAVTDVDIDDADAERGDTVDGEVTVENTGNREHTFFVGYSVYDPIGEVSNGETAGAVTLSPDESETVDAEWTVPDDARAGAYDARVSVWRESDPDRLATRLGDERVDGAFRVREEPDIDAAIRDVNVAGGTYDYGERVETSVTVENTGNREHTFFVGYGVYDPSNRYYDNGGTTGTPVTLAPDETRTVDVSWRVREGREAGRYDAIVAVWKESDRDRLSTRLGDRRVTDSFAVRPEREVLFSVTKKSTVEGFAFDGEPLADATVRVAGETYTTDSDGEVSLELPVDDYEFTVDADGYERARGRLSMNARTGLHFTSVALVRDNVGIVEAAVVDENGDALAGNTYRLLVDGERRTPTRGGELLLAAGEHTITVEPTEFGESEGVEQAKRRITVSEGKRMEVTLKAISKQYPLSVDVPEEGGTAVVAGTAVRETVSKTYEEGETVSITAKPAVGYEFDHWKGGYPSGDQENPSIEVTVNEPTTLTPVFTAVSGQTTIVGYDPQSGEYDNRTATRAPGSSSGLSVAETPTNTSWSRVTPPSTDYRRNRTNTTEDYPWSAVGRLTSYAGSCSATVVDDNHVITAAHCVYDTETGIWKYGLTFTPGENVDTHPFGKVNVTYVQTYERWLSAGERTHDIAVLTLEESISNRTGTFGYEANPSDSQAYQTTVHVTGYPGDSVTEYVDTLGEQWDIIGDGEGTDIAISPGRDPLTLADCWKTDFCHDFATGGGFSELVASGVSGAAVWQSDADGRPRIISVFSGKSAAVDPLADGIAVRISANKHRDIGQMIRRGDEVADRVSSVSLTASQQTVQTGKSITFEAQLKESVGTVQSYAWDTDGDGTVEATTANPTTDAVYESAGNYTAEVTVTTVDGQQTTGSVEIAVKNTSESQSTLSEISVQIDNVSSCGLTCRDLTYTVENPTDETLEDVDVDVTLLTEGDAVWNGSEAFDQITPGTRTETRTVELSSSAGYEIAKNDYNVTIEVEIRTASERKTVTIDGQL